MCGVCVNTEILTLTVHWNTDNSHISVQWNTGHRFYQSMHLWCSCSWSPTMSKKAYFLLVSDATVYSISRYSSLRSGNHPLLIDINKSFEHGKKIFDSHTPEGGTAMDPYRCTFCFPMFLTFLNFLSRQVKLRYENLSDARNILCLLEKWYFSKAGTPSRGVRVKNFYLFSARVKKWFYCELNANSLIHCEKQKL
jgi:hypothetical protein